MNILDPKADAQAFAAAAKPLIDVATADIQGIVTNGITQLGEECKALIAQAAAESRTDITQLDASLATAVQLFEAAGERLIDKLFDRLGSGGLSGLFPQKG